MVISTSKNSTMQFTRPHDYAYDPLFIVSGPKDEYKAALIAKLNTAKFQICPIFMNMFSDLPNHPRKQLVMRQTSHEVHRSYNTSGLFSKSKKVDVIGVDRVKFFFRPSVDLKPISPVLDVSEKVRTPSKLVDERVKNKRNQTIYRESSAQTSPWEPPYKIMDGTDPEILKLDFLKWGSGLPAGVHEVKLIERARMKRAWEARFRLEGNENVDKRRDVIEIMEHDEWLFREQEIQDIQDLRLKLLEEMLNELHQKSKNRNQAKLKNFAEVKLAEKNEKLSKLKKKGQRELRKLDMQFQNVFEKYTIPNVVDEHINRHSELYAPLMRHGDNPKHWHQVIDETMKLYKAQFIGVELFNTLPRRLEEAPKIDNCKVQLPGTRLCQRETKWTTPILKELHEELKNLHKTTKQRCNLRKRRVLPPSPPGTPEVEALPDIEEGKFQTTIYLQSLLRGRATQMLIYEGRDRCRQLIQELKYSTGLIEEQRAQICKEKSSIKHQQREDNLKNHKVQTLQANLNKLQGNVVGSLLDFLNKELRRLQEERKIHAMCILFERERQTREAAEAGRRQQELRRRREHDEMFKQMAHIHQDTVDLYLEGIVREGIEFTSDIEAKEFITNLAKKIDEEAYKTMETEESLNKCLEDEELIADLVHHVLLPEIDKELVRERIQKQQKQNLKTIHNAIYSEFESLPQPQHLSSELELDSILTAKSTETVELFHNVQDPSADDIEDNAGLKTRSDTDSSINLNVSHNLSKKNEAIVDSDLVSQFNEQFLNFDSDDHRLSVYSTISYTPIKTGTPHTHIENLMELPSNYSVSAKSIEESKLISPTKLSELRELVAKNIYGTEEQNLNEVSERKRHPLPSEISKEDVSDVSDVIFIEGSRQFMVDSTTLSDEESLVVEASTVLTPNFSNSDNDAN